MSAKSKSQQRLFGMVHSCQKTGNCYNSKILKISKNISLKKAKKFAKTKHKGLPNKKKKKTFKEWLNTKHPKFDILK